MKTKEFKYLLVFLFMVLIVSKTSYSQQNYIRLVVPESDTTTIPQLHQQFSGSTIAGSELTINGEGVHVYPSGAFVAFPLYNSGMNKVEIESNHPVYGKAQKTVWLNCVLPVPEKVTSEFNIDYVRLMPNQDQNLVSGDVLMVKVKAQPGNNVKVFGQSLKELPAELTGGVAGIYQGEYKITPADSFALAPVEVEMINKAGEKVTAKSNVQVSFNSRDFNRYARTSGKLTPIYMGLGTDRLGGAKFGYLDSAIVVNVTGMIGDMVRVRLSAGTEAWINKNNLTLLPEGFMLSPHMLTTSLSIMGNGNADFVKIPLPERLPYTSNMEINPNRIELDIYGVTSNTNWITQMTSATEIKNIYYRQIAPDVFRLTIELNHKQCWGYAISYQNRTLVVKVKHQPVKLKISDLKIALDAGHGGENNGAVGATGLKEKDINLAMVLKLKRELEKRGATVVLTRADDTEKSNTEKWQALLPHDPDILICIHNNSIGNGDP
ncbi:MAG TPA: N-acetylmuramoyl-L-alanine amidase, partial [Bacteroidales bacterium]|nr:N-acetylmuramoyl-L-alanine amidase [Bacteroidales bacterium]